MKIMGHKGSKRNVGALFVSLIIILMLTSCNNKNGPMDIEDTGVDFDSPLLRTLKWSPEDHLNDHNIQFSEDRPGRNVDVTNVIFDKSFGPPAFELQGYVVKTGAYSIGGASFDITMTVVAWVEKLGTEPDEYWNVFLRVVYWWRNPGGDLEHGMTPVIEVSNPAYANQTNPAVTAHLNTLDVFGGGGSLGATLYIDMVYQEKAPENNAQVIYRAYSYLVRSTDDVALFSLPSGSDPEPMPLPYEVPGHCRCPDIVFYSFEGDENHNACDGLFAIYEFESTTGVPEIDFYSIMAFAAKQPYSFGNADWEDHEQVCLVSRPKVPPEGELNRMPLCPRIDAGFDSSVGHDGASVVIPVWHEWKWGDGGYFDIDWYRDMVPIDPWIEDELLYSIICSTINDPFEYAAYPDVDIDPLEKLLEDGYPSYSHFVVTEGDDQYNTDFRVAYYNSLTAGVLMQEVHFDAGTDSGLATITMYAEQSWDDEVPDFDVVFLYNEEEDEVYPVFSREFYFDDVYWTDIEPTGGPIEISDNNNESYANYPYLSGPVGAVFEWKNEEVAWTCREVDQVHEYHRIYGDFNINE